MDPSAKNRMRGGVFFFSSSTPRLLELLSSESVRQPRRRNAYRIPRIQGYADLCSDMNATVFKSHFRMHRSTVEDILSHVCCSFLPKHNNYKKYRGILLSLWYFANQEGFRQISDRFGLSLSAAHRTVGEFCRVINSNTALAIRWPEGVDLTYCIEGFNSLRENSFPGVVGAVDGCHIKILAPWKYRTRMPHLDRNSFINRKQVASVLLQGICNSKLEFINVFAGWPGSSNDARVFRRSEIGRALLDQPQFLPQEAHIIGDCAYPLLPTVMTPYRDTGHLNQQQRFYNYKLSSSRIVIEQAFGKLLARFRRLRCLDVYNKNLAGSYIMTSCVLHNVCQRLGDNIEPIEFDGGVLPQTVPANSVTGAHKRDALARRLFERIGD